MGEGNRWPEECCTDHLVIHLPFPGEVLNRNLGGGGFGRLDETLTRFKAKDVNFATPSKRKCCNFLPCSRPGQIIPYSKQWKRCVSLRFHAFQRSARNQRNLCDRRGRKGEDLPWPAEGMGLEFRSEFSRSCSDWLRESSQALICQTMEPLCLPIHVTVGNCCIVGRVKVFRQSKHNLCRARSPASFRNKFFMLIGHLLQPVLSIKLIGSDNTRRHLDEPWGEESR